MRLKHIKLVGFKSFVDATIVKLPSNLVGIVGPNGCGKSNIIDAVRWVMGEGSAKHLRGESMADVIFNGSSTRKPVGQAQIELVFDNRDGSAGGAYASYAEIAIKRSIGREGTSTYYLNNTKCRRRDIIDIFLGTGLGSRSYSIIEQGMISRVIEAKPEELRIYLEEVAGISKYKERRRETENRINRTTENLDRITDIREELGKQLATLKRQAGAAQRYKEYKEEERILKAQLHALNWVNYDSQISEQETQIKHQENAIHAKVAELQNVATKNEEFRDQLTDYTDAFNEVQRQYYGIGAEIARIEQNIQSRTQRSQQIKQDLQQTQVESNDVQQQLQRDQQQVSEITLKLENIKPKYEALQEQSQKSAYDLDLVQQQMDEWQQLWDDFNQKSAQFSQTVQVEQTRMQHLEQQLNQQKQLVTTLSQEKATLDLAPLQNQIEQLQAACDSQLERLQETQDALENVQQQREEEKRSLEQMQHNLDEAKSNLQTLLGKQASLQALQDSVLQNDNQQAQQWLAAHDIDEQKRLARFLQVAEGWERAVEIALGSLLQSFCSDDLKQYLESGQLPDASISLFKASENAINPESLASKITNQHYAPLYFNDIFPVNDISEAIAYLPQLQEHQSVITQQGIWMSADWVKVISMEDNAASGLLKREQELKTLAEQLASVHDQIDEMQQQLHYRKTSLQALDDTRDHYHSKITEIKIALADHKSQYENKQQTLARETQRLTKISVELEQAEQKIIANSRDFGSAEQKWREASLAIESDADKRQQLMDNRDEYQQQLENVRQAAREDRDQLHQYEMEVQNCQTRLSSLQDILERLQRQASNLEQRQIQLSDLLADSEEPLVSIQDELEKLLDKRLIIEKDMQSKRAKVEECEHQLRELTQARDEVEDSTQAIREKLEKLRLHWQTLVVKRDAIVDELIANEFVVQSLVDELPGEANIADWQNQIEDVTKRIQRLGAINLAAIEEYDIQEERKRYLDAQHEDLDKALNILKDAIQKIDRETRMRLRDTFELVSKHFQDIFPKVFGGGSASLELTGDELLEAGVRVMARPPGKRNSTIHLLSGGEKALTAISLVFALFQLNPSPFCLLDEVDAPLDDLNVSRFCALVKEMSKQTQFLVITHNKVTMELVDHLMGVTMNEPGVSRLVAVDVEEALSITDV